MGSLNVYVNKDGTLTQVFSLSGNQGNNWISSGNIDLSTFDGQDIKIRIEEVRGTDYRDNAAIDNISDTYNLDTDIDNNRTVDNNDLDDDIDGHTFAENVGGYATRNRAMGLAANSAQNNSNKNLVISKNDEVTIKNVALYTILREKVQLWEISKQKNTFSLNIKEQLPIGIYIVKINSLKGTINQKIVIE